MGIIVQYKVKVKLIVSMGGDLAVELPFTLTHPKPPPSPSPSRADLSSLNTSNNTSQNEKSTNDQAVPVDLNLIQFDTK